MMKTLRNIPSSLKKFSLLVLLVGMSWVVYAGPQVKIVKCYPNPATSIINFDFQKSIDRSYSLQIYSFSGRKMIETSAGDGKITITLDNFYRGIYVYQLRDKEGKIVESGKFQVVK